MRKMQIVAGALALALIGAPVFAASEFTEEKTLSYKGTITELNPSTSTFMFRSETSSAPTTYAFTKQTTVVDPQGNVVAWSAIKNTPVTVFYAPEGERMVVSKVVTTKPAMELRKETTTTTTTTE
jgi:hypothetical protein